MLATKSKIKAETELAREVRKLTKDVRQLKNLEFLRVFKHPWKFMWFSFLKGLMVGFGSILGASVLVGLFVFLLAQVSFVPVLGDFIEDIMAQIQIENRQESGSGVFEQYREQKEEAKSEEKPAESHTATDENVQN